MGCRRGTLTRNGLTVTHGKISVIKQHPEALSEYHSEKICCSSYYHAHYEKRCLKSLIFFVKYDFTKGFLNPAETY